MRNLLYLLPILLVVGLLALFWQGLDPKRNPSALPSALIGRPAPAIDLPSLAPDAPRLDLGAYGGQLIAVNFFASWCAPCRAEHPYLQRLTGEFGVPVIGIAWRDKPADARAFLAELGDPYRATGDDEGGRAGIDFGLSGVPETFLIDKDGIVRFRLANPITPDTLKDQLAPAIAEASR